MNGFGNEHLRARCRLLVVIGSLSPESTILTHSAAQRWNAEFAWRRRMQETPKMECSGRMVRMTIVRENGKGRSTALKKRIGRVCVVEKVSREL